LRSAYYHGDSLAVLGIVMTMGALGGPKEAIGEKVASALVGTFAGVLLCYGILGQNEAESAYFGSCGWPRWVT
jgi:chemotaxis protein MotA